FASLACLLSLFSTPPVSAISPPPPSATLFPYTTLFRSHFEEGRYWVYNTYEGWQEQFPFWSVSTIKRTLVRLEESGLLITANYNKMKIDRTKWYTVDYDKLDDLAKKN